LQGSHESWNSKVSILQWGVDCQGLGQPHPQALFVATPLAAFQGYPLISMAFPDGHGMSLIAVFCCHPCCGSITPFRGSNPVMLYQYIYICVYECVYIYIYICIYIYIHIYMTWMPWMNMWDGWEETSGRERRWLWMVNMIKLFCISVWKLHNEIPLKPIQSGRGEKKVRRVIEEMKLIKAEYMHIWKSIKHNVYNAAMKPLSYC
jgi:hypothetical protein